MRTKSRLYIRIKKSRSNDTGGSNMLSEQRKVTDVLRVLILLEKKVATFRPENDKDTVKKLTRSSPNKITNSLLPPTTIFFQFYI